MTKFELVVHVAVDLDGATPEEAAAVFKRELRAGVDPGAMLLGLAVWRPWDGSTPTPLPSPLPQQLNAFFAGVEGSAAAAEEAFRLRVAEIMGDRATRIATPSAADEPGFEQSDDPVGDAWETDRWETDGGGTVTASAATIATRFEHHSAK